MTIQPALTAEEWERKQRQLAGRWMGGITPETNTAKFREIALLNSELPDDDPRRITREDVEAVQFASEHLIGFNDYVPTALSTLAAKLAALLPPE